MLKGALRAMRLMDKDGSLSMTYFLIYLWVILILSERGLSWQSLACGLMIIVSWNAQKYIDHKKASILSDSDKTVIEELSDRISKLETLISLHEQRRMF